MLNVFLGYACNFRCGYCLQSPGAATAERRKHDTGRFARRIVPLVRQWGIREIAYWGGEPLLYWRHIVAIHEALLAAGLAFDSVKVVTNGSLLEDRHVEALNRWGAFVVVSQHEAYGEPRWQQVARLERSSLSFLFRHGELYAWDWFDRLDALEQRWGRPFWPYAHWARATDGCDASFYLTHDDLDRHVPHLRELARLRLAGHRHASTVFEGHLRDWRQKLAPGGDAVPMCHGPHHLSVDLDGNRYGCHHSVRSDLRTGNLFAHEDPTPETAAALDHVARFVGSAECRACPIRSWCRGNCHLSNTHDVDCRLSKEKHRVLAWLDAQENGPSDRNRIRVP